MKNRMLALFLMSMTTIGMSGLKVHADETQEATTATSENTSQATAEVKSNSEAQTFGNLKTSSTEKNNETQCEELVIVSQNVQNEDSLHTEADMSKNVVEPQSLDTATHDLVEVAKVVSQNNFTYYSDLDSEADIYNKGDYYSYGDMAAVKDNSAVTINDASQVVKDYTNLSDDEMKEVNTFAAQLINTARESVWKTALSAEISNADDWKLVITDKSMALAKKVAEEYDNDKWSIWEKEDHNYKALERAYAAFGMPEGAYFENYGSTILTEKGKWSEDRTKTMLDVKSALFKTLVTMLYNDKTAFAGGANVGKEDNGHAYSLTYGGPKGAYVPNYFGLAFDKMGQVHIVNVPMNWTNVLGDNILEYQATFGDTNGIDVKMPREYQNYLATTGLYAEHIDDIKHNHSNVRKSGDYYFVVTNGKTYLYNQNYNQLLGQQQVGGAWYYFDETSAQMVTGFKYISNQKKTVYYNIDGKMQYGQRYINGSWYNFDLVSGAMSTGLTYIPGQRKLVFYGNDGKMQYRSQNINGVIYSFDHISGALIANGQKQINGKWYLFKNNQVQTGFQWIANQHKTVYYDPTNGKMQYGQKQINGAWYLFDSISGAMKTGLQKISNQNKTVYYGMDGKMRYGQVKIGNAWYNFNKVSGAMQTGVVYIADQNKLVYYASNGKMQYGKQQIAGKTYMLNRCTGAIEGNGQINVAGQWYFLKNGRPLTGLQRIVNQNKTVYYNPVTAQMVHGQAKIGNSWYYFDDISGAMKKGFVTIESQNKTVYYDGNGKMVYGKQLINSKTYTFDNVTGALLS